MAAQPVRLASANIASILPRVSAPVTIASSRWATFYAQQLSHPLLPSLSVGIPGISLSLPSLLGDIWDAVLRAVPKKKVSHSKKRHRQMAGKALEDVNSLCKCPGCGQTKRTHRLCPACMLSTLGPFDNRRASSLLTWIQRSTRYGSRTTRPASLLEVANARGFVGSGRSRTV